MVIVRTDPEIDSILEYIKRWPNVHIAVGISARPKLIRRLRLIQRPLGRLFSIIPKSKCPLRIKPRNPRIGQPYEVTRTKIAITQIYRKSKYKAASFMHSVTAFRRWPWSLGHPRTYPAQPTDIQHSAVKCVCAALYENYAHDDSLC